MIASSESASITGIIRDRKETSYSQKKHNVTVHITH